MIFDGIRVYITLDEIYEGKVMGLCGTYNFNSQDDFTASNNIIETNIVAFSDSYKVDPTSSTPSQTNPCDMMITVSLKNYLSLLKIE